MEVDDATNSTESKVTDIVNAVDEVSDLSTCIRGYNYISGVRKLVKIAECNSNGNEFSKASLSLALETIKLNSLNGDLGKEVIEKYLKCGESTVILDGAWICKALKEYKARLNTLERKLDQCKIAQNPVDIYKTLLCIGDLCYEAGLYNKAIDKFNDCNLHVSTEEEQSILALKKINTWMAMGYSSNIKACIDKCIAIFPESDHYVRDVLYTIKAVNYMGVTKDYPKVVQCLLECKGIIMQDNDGEADCFKTHTYHCCLKDMNWLTSKDVGVYLGLFALASYERPQLLELVTNVVFKSYMEYVPSIDRLVKCFIGIDYPSFFATLNQIQVDFKSNVYCDGPSLVRLIRNKAIKQYIEPFKIVVLETMANDFHTSVCDLIEELVALSSANQIQFTINLYNKTMERKYVQPKLTLLEDALSVTEKFARNAYCTVLNSNLIREKIDTGTSGNF